uniref:Calcineurin-like phosphoesterase domain-containing protein n=2 Tax=Oryza brachyantha TaxID=4533 RepID=J3N7B9_ORYBR
MNVSGDFRFATPQGLREFSAWAGWYRAGLAIKRRCAGLDPKNPFLGVPKAFPGVRPEFWDGIRSRLAALRPDGPIARRFLADLPTVLVVGDSVFVHGGLLEANVEYGLERINAEVSEWIRGERGANAAAPEYVRGRDAVVWLRRFSDGVNCDCQRLEGVLEMIPGAKRMIMGHTIQTEGINAVCGAQAVRVDVGLSRGCGNGLPEVLEINGGGKDVRVITTDPAEAWQYRKREAEKTTITTAVKEKKGEVKDGLALLVRESHGLKEVQAKA